MEIGNTEYKKTVQICGTGLVLGQRTERSGRSRRKALWGTEWEKEKGILTGVLRKGNLGAGVWEPEPPKLQAFGKNLTPFLVVGPKHCNEEAWHE